MLKTHGHRKLALLLALVFVTSLIAACSSSQSSTDEPLSHPGKDYLGAIRMDMDPKSGSIEITKLDDAISNTVLTKLSGFTVSSNTTSCSGCGFAGGTLSGDITFKWTGAERLEEMSLRVFDADATGLNAQVMTADECKGKTVGQCKALTTPSGLVYVGDLATEGPETEYEWVYDKGPGQDRGLRLMPPGCDPTHGNSITARWQMTETTAGFPKYTFYAHVYGKKVPADYTADSRYDPNTAGIYMKAYAVASTSATNPGVDTNRPLTYVKNGQWFWLFTYADAPGKQSRNQTTQVCADGNGNTTCNLDPATAEDYDFYFVEDQANFDLLSTAGYWKTSSAYNTGFLFCAHATFMMQWDPAVLKTNTMDGDTSKGTGVNAFRTKGATGTKMVTWVDTSPTDQWADDTTVASNNTNRCLSGYLGKYNYAGVPKTYPPLPDGLDGSEYGSGVQQGDYPSGAFALKAIGPSGSGSAIRLSPSGNTTYNAGLGKKTANETADRWITVQKSANYPIWAYATGVAEGPGGSIGHFNEQIAWVCVQ